jgi:hypothetical protein
MTMKKRVMTIFCLPFLLLVIGKSSPSKLGWKSFVIYPLSMETTQEINFVYSALATIDHQAYILKITLQNIRYPQGVIVFQNTEYLNKGIRKDIRRVFFLDGQAVTEGANLFVFSCESKGIYDVEEAEAYPRVETTFYPSEENYFLSLPYNYIELQNGVCASRRDRFVFHGFTSIIEDEYYYYLDLSSLWFESENPFEYESINLLIKRRGTLYNLLSYSMSPDYRSISLGVSQVSNHYKFTFATPLYVEPNSLLMSITPRNGFLETTKFFFPRNFYSSEKEIEMRIIIRKAGYNQFDIQYNFTYFSNLRYIGDCHNSQYCIMTSSTSSEDKPIDWEEIETC